MAEGWSPPGRERQPPRVTLMAEGWSPLGRECQPLRVNMKIKNSVIKHAAPVRRRLRINSKYLHYSEKYQDERLFELLNHYSFRRNH